MNLLPTITSAEVSGSVAVLPVGSFEQHGDHLPLATDTIIACLLAERIADAYRLFLLPPISIACSHEHSTFRGTVSIGPGTLVALIDDIRSSLMASGIENLAIINAHGGNYVLSNICQQANIAGPKVALFPGRDDWTYARNEAGMLTTSHDDMHAGEMETSILLHADPSLVRDTYRHADHEAPSRPHFLVTGMAGYTSSGVIGKPSLATPEKGAAALDALVAAFADVLKLLR